jgi:putative hydrolase of the HAD superfamily
VIETVIFDFGGVLLDLDFNRTFSELAAVTGVDFDPSLIHDQAFTTIYHNYEKGLITDEVLLWNIQRLSQRSQDPRLIVQAWNAMLLGWDAERFGMLEVLRQRYQLLLLSNTNHLHIQWVRRNLKVGHGITDFEERFFDKVYYSYEIHHRKPDASVYDYVTRDAGLNPATTLFIDDSPVNVEAARKCGWHAVLHDPHQQDITEAIDGYIMGCGA